MEELDYSILSLSLYGLINDDHYECWCYFVEACQLICQPIITKTGVAKAHDLIISFCSTYEQLYGKENCTPNMHMACHLKEIIFDYGSIYGFWCFSFERYNGLLEGMKKSWVCPEKQLLLKFLDLQQVYDHNSSETFDDFNSLLHAEIKKLRSSENISGSLSQMALEGMGIVEQARMLTGGVSLIDVRENEFHKASQPLYEKCFLDMEIDYLFEIYKEIFPNNAVTHISRFYKQFKTLVINDEEYISSAIGRIDTMGMGYPRIGVIQSFIRHKLTISDLPSSSGRMV